MRPHFFKAHSRLGIINIPHGGTERNVGVEYGPDAVLSKSFLDSYQNPPVSAFSFPLPEEIDQNTYTSQIAHSSKKFCDFINEQIRAHETQVVVGGDHSVAFGSLLAVLKRFENKKIGYVQFDSHGDVNLFSSSPTGNFHGMWLRPFFGDFDNPEILDLIHETLRPEQILFIGNLDLDPEEQKFFTDKKISTISKSNSVNLEKFIKKFSHIHVSFDIDVFDKKLVSATGTPARNGLSAQGVFPLLAIISKAKSISFDLVEVNPKKRGVKKTVKLAQDVIEKFIPKTLL